MHAANESEALIESNCDIDTDLYRRLIFLSFGALLAVFGCFCNALLLFTFILYPRRNPSLYYKILSLLDLLMCLTYIWMFFIPKLAVVMRNVTLYDLVWQTNIFIYPIGRMVQCAIPYVIIAQTAERLLHLLNSNNCISKSDAGRLFIVITMLMIIIALRIPTMWAVELTRNEDCEYFSSAYLSGTKFSQSQFFISFDIGVNFLHVIASFLILLALNMIIVRKHRQCHRKARTESALVNTLLLVQPSLCDRNREKLEKLRLRAAIKTSMMIISTYLACNSLHFCLFLVEQFNISWLLNEAGNDYNWIYVMLSDFVSILFVVSSTIRLPIYYKVNQEIRQQLNEALRFKKSGKTLRLPISLE